MGRDSFPSALKLALVKKSQAGRKKRDHRRGSVGFRRKGCRGPRFVVIFQKSIQFILVVQPRAEMLAHRSGGMLPPAVVEAFSISVIESLLPRRPVQVQVAF